MSQVNRFASLCLVLFTVIWGMPALAGEAAVGKEAPDFTATDTKGKSHNLSDYAGKIVVLEWFNHGCPFVQKHYNSGNMQGLQKTFKEKGVVWLSIISSAPGKQGYCTPEQGDEIFKDWEAAPAAVLLDPEGTVGKLYGAKTTPHMFIINAGGILVYDGGIDDIRSTNVDDIPKATNYVKKALDELLAGKEVSVKTSQPYGCSVKYKEDAAS